MTNLWLDDMRTPPEGDWVWVKTADQAIEAFKREGASIEYASLDHDLDFWDYHYDYYSSDSWKDPIKDGIEVVRWMVEANYWTPKLGIHTDNMHGQKNMRELVDAYGPYNSLKDIVYNREVASDYDRSVQTYLYTLKYPAILYEV